MTIYDSNGNVISVGSRIEGWTSPDGKSSIPGGVVTKIEDADVDMNDDTGRPEQYGPFVHVLYDDGEEDRWTAYRDEYYESGDYKCDEVRVDLAGDGE